MKNNITISEKVFNYTTKEGESKTGTMFILHYNNVSVAFNPIKRDDKKVLRLIAEQTDE